jgi:hypothetical protein
MKAPHYYSARVFTADHTSIAGLPMYAADILVDLKDGQAASAHSRVIEIADRCFRRRFAIGARMTEIDRVTEARLTGDQFDWQYEDEDGKSVVSRDLSDYHPQRG